MNKNNLFALNFVENKFQCEKAAIACGYSPKSARTQATRMIQRKEVQDEISKILEERANRTKVDCDWILKELACMAKADIRDCYDVNGNFKRIKDLPPGISKLILSIDIMEIPTKCDITGDKTIESKIKRIRFTDKLKVIEQLGKHIDIQAFAERKELNVKGQITIQNLHDTIKDDVIDLGIDYGKPIDTAGSEISEEHNNRLETETPEIF